MRYCGPINGRARKRVVSSGKSERGIRKEGKQEEEWSIGNLFSCVPAFLISFMFLHVARVVFILLEVLILFNLLIVVHEIGHFLAARWRGLYIEKFGIWFGKPLWKKTINGVQYSLGSLPFGGFVALPQLAPMDIIEGKADLDRAKLPPISALDKIIVAFAGPLFSFLLAIAFAIIIWAVGRPVSEAEATTTIGYVLPDSPAAEARLQPGDKILSIDGHPVHRFGGMGDDSITWRIVRSEGDKIDIVIERGGERQTVNVKPEIQPTKAWQRKGFREIGIVPAETPLVHDVEPGSPAAKAGLRPNDLIVSINGQPLYHLLGLSTFIHEHPNEPITLGVERGRARSLLPFDPPNPRISEVTTGSPAEEAGLRVDDIVIAINGHPVKSAATFYALVRQNRERPLTVTISRGGKQSDVTITPRIPKGEKVPRIGVGCEDRFGIIPDDLGKTALRHPAPSEQIRQSMLSIVNTVGAVASSKSDVKLQHMSGPIMMMQVFYRMFASHEGWRMALWFSVVLNVNLALLNLLPIPVLDGGHILLALIEAVRRRPVNMRVLEVVQTACAVLIIGFMVYIAFFDVQDLPFFGKRDTPKFLPKSAPAKSDQ
jgi:regulator of sigma E protease